MTRWARPRLSDGRIDLRKDVGKVDAVAAKYNLAEMCGSRGIAQLRWATFGEPSQVNAQPHLDSDGDMVGAHNGNVVNNHELRQQFMAEGMLVRSQNDGETCVHAVERYIHRGYEFIDAIRLAYGDLAGDYAFVIGRVNEDCLYAIKKGSGMVIGLGEGFTCISSDLPSILPLTRKIIRVQDGEIVTLWADHVALRSVRDGKPILRDPELVTQSMDAVQKAGYPHFMLKEIHEQSQVARELLHLLDASPDLDAVVEKIRKARHVYYVGCGTSYHAALAGAIYGSQLAGVAVNAVVAPQFTAQYAPAISHEDAGLFVSQSGETKDVLNALQSAEKMGMTCYGLANVVGSTLTKATALCLPLCCGYEISVPATKTFTNQVLTFLYLAYRLAGRDTQRTPRASRSDGPDHRDGCPPHAGDRILHQHLERPLLPGLRRHVSLRAGGRLEAQGDHVCSLRRHALHRIQAWPSLGSNARLPGDLRRRPERCAVDRERHQRSHLPRRARHRDRPGERPAASQCHGAGGHPRRQPADLPRCSRCSRCNCCPIT